MEVETFPYVMAHLPKYKGKGPCGDVYEHYQAMPPCFVQDLCDRALNGQISEGFAGLWRSGLLHVGDKERLDREGRRMVGPLQSGWLFVGLQVGFRVLSLSMSLLVCLQSFGSSALQCRLGSRLPSILCSWQSIACSGWLTATTP